jgi:hypothetical protein
MIHILWFGAYTIFRSGRAEIKFSKYKGMTYRWGCPILWRI